MRLASEWFPTTVQIDKGASIAYLRMTSRELHLGLGPATSERSICNDLCNKAKLRKYFRNQKEAFSIAPHKRSSSAVTHRSVGAPRLGGQLHAAGGHLPAQQRKQRGAGTQAQATSQTPPLAGFVQLPLEVCGSHLVKSLPRMPDFRPPQCGCQFRL